MRWDDSVEQNACLESRLAPQGADGGEAPERVARQGDARQVQRRSETGILPGVEALQFIEYKSEVAEPH